jgi:hypothetical protein
MNRLVLALALAFLAVAPSAVAKDKLYAIIIADTDAKDIGPSCAIDLKTTKSLLIDGFKDHKERLSLKVLEGKDSSLKSLAQALVALPEKLDDTDSLLVIISCHGGYIPALNLHVLVINSGKKDPGKKELVKKEMVGRDDLLKLMKAKGGRLQLLITDACASVPRNLVTKGPGDKAPEWKTIEALFFTQTGLLDVNACALRQVSFCDKQGSYFLRALSDRLRKPYADLVRPGAATLTWQDILPDLQGDVRKLFKEMLTLLEKGVPGLDPGTLRDRLEALLKRAKSQGDQTLGVWSVPEGRMELKPDANGLVYLPRRGKARGVEVVVVGMKPAVGLVTGDIIIKANGKTTDGPAEFRKQLKSKGDIKVTFLRGVTVKEAHIVGETK